MMMSVSLAGFCRKVVGVDALTILALVGLPASSQAIVVLIWNSSSKTVVSTWSLNSRFFVLACLVWRDQMTMTGRRSGTGTRSV